MKKINFQIVTPERVVLHKDIDSLTCPTEMGQITVLPGHLPIIAALRAGELMTKENGKQEFFAVSGGFVEVRPGNTVIILADTAERDSEIDAKRAEEAKMRAEALLKEKQTMSEEEYALIAAKLQRDLARLKVVKRRSHRHQAIESAE